MGRNLKPLMWGVSGLMLAASLAFLVYRAWPTLFPEGVARAPLNPDCDLHLGACSVEFEDGAKVTLSIEPRPIPLVKPLTLDVTVRGLKPRTVEIDFAGMNMNMGYNRVRLEQGGTGHYFGQGILPVCVRNHMAWEVKVLILTDAGYLVAPFRFDTYRQGGPDS